MSNNYATAFKLLTLGFSVIPSGGGDKHKAPLVNWREWQGKAPDDDRLERWQMDLNPALWGIVTNHRVAVIDADTPETRVQLEAELGDPHVITPRGGAHWYIDTTGHPVKTVAGLLPGMDIRGVGGFVNIAGGKYQILRLPVPGDTLIPWDELPKHIIAAIEGSKPAHEKKQGAPIPEKTRNATLASIAGAMRRKGANQSAIESALLEINAKQCQPPISESEVLKIAKSVSRYEPERDTDQPEHFNLTDYGNAERLVTLFGDVIRYSPERKVWLIWTGKVWEWDIGRIRITKLAKKTARNIYQEAADEPDDDAREELVKHGRATERQVRIEALIKSAESEPGVAVNLADLDANHWLLNVSNGPIDLRTGELKPHSRAELITKILPIDYDPIASSTEWDSFLTRIFDGNTDLIAYVQRALGYSITGDQSEQAFFFCYGGGFNEKSTLLNTCRLVMGEYATQVPPTAFMVDKTKRGGPDEAIANLQSKRLVCSTELEDGQRLSVSLVKRMTGGESLWCEHKFERGYNFQPTHKLWLSGNHEPVITDTTNSIWFRLKKIPFMVEIPEADRKKGYAEHLAEEHSAAIMAWVRGVAENRQPEGAGSRETGGSRIPRPARYIP
ncbi:phage/plasmid primase, P4 family [Chloroflexota bacterium]